MALKVDEKNSGETTKVLPPVLKVDKTFIRHRGEKASEILKIYPINDKKLGCHRPKIRKLLHPRVHKDKLTTEELHLLNYFMEDVKGIVTTYDDKDKYARRLRVDRCKGMGMISCDVPFEIPVVIPRAFVSLMNRMVVPQYEAGEATEASKYVAGAENETPGLKRIGEMPRIMFREI